MSNLIKFQTSKIAIYQWQLIILKNLFRVVYSLRTFNTQIETNFTLLLYLALTNLTVLKFATHHGITLVDYKILYTLNNGGNSNNKFQEAFISDFKTKLFF